MLSTFIHYLFRKPSGQVITRFICCLLLHTIFFSNFPVRLSYVLYVVFFYTLSFSQTFRSGYRTFYMLSSFTHYLFLKPSSQVIIRFICYLLLHTIFFSNLPVRLSHVLYVIFFYTLSFSETFRSGYHTFYMLSSFTHYLFLKPSGQVITRFICYLLLHTIFFWNLPVRLSHVLYVIFFYTLSFSQTVRSGYHTFYMLSSFTHYLFLKPSSQVITRFICYLLLHTIFFSNLPVRLSHVLYVIFFYTLSFSQTFRSGYHTFYMLSSFAHYLFLKSSGQVIVLSFSQTFRSGYHTFYIIWGRCNLKRSRRTVIFLPVYKISSLKITPPTTPNSGQFSFLFRLEFRFRSRDFSFNLFPFGSHIVEDFEVP